MKWEGIVANKLTVNGNKPVTINEIRVYGFGWQFEGQLADVNIIGY